MRQFFELTSQETYTYVNEGASSVKTIKQPVNVTAVNSQIVIADQGEALIVTLDGKATTVQAPTSVPVPKGVYIVKIGNAETKILVK